MASEITTDVETIIKTNVITVAQRQNIRAMLRGLPFEMRRDAAKALVSMAVRAEHTKRHGNA